MALNSHYIPQTMLKFYGEQYDVFRLDTNDLKTGLISTQEFFEHGLYSEILEEDFTLFEKEIKGFFEEIISNPETIKEKREDVVRTLLLCFLRTPAVKSKVDDEEQWEKTLTVILKNKCELECLRLGNPDIDGKIKLIEECEYALLQTDDEAEPLMISDVVVTFRKNGSVVFPFGKHYAIVGSKHKPQKLHLSANEVCELNAEIMNGCYACLGMGKLEKSYESIKCYAKLYPDSKRFNALILKIKKYDIRDEDIAAFTENQKRMIKELNIPKPFFQFVGKTITDKEIEDYKKRKDRRHLSAFLLMKKYGLIKSSCKLNPNVFDYLCKNDVFVIVNSMKDAGSDFEKRCNIFLLEYAAEIKNPYACDKLYRYYRDGKHVEKDEEKSEYYLKLGCDCSMPDCLIVLIKRNWNNKEYEKNLGPYLTKIKESKNAIVLGSFARMLKTVGDIEGYYQCMEKSAFIGYDGPISITVNNYARETPLNLEKIRKLEKIALKKNMLSIVTIAKLYLDNPDECPGLYDSLVLKLEKKESRYVIKVKELSKNKESR